MNRLLKPGQTLRGESSNALCTVEQYLGGSSHCEVCRADLDGKQVALKWYFANFSTPEQRAFLGRLIPAIDFGISPSPTCAQVLPPRSVWLRPPGRAM